MQNNVSQQAPGHSDKETVRMIYTHTNPSVFIISGMMLALGVLAQFGVLDDITARLGVENKIAEIQTMGIAFGSLGLLVGLYALLPHKSGPVDYYAGAIPGALFVLILAMLVKWIGAPLIAIGSRYLGDQFGLVYGDKYIHNFMGLNHVTLGIITGLIVVNFLSVPKWARHGVRVSRMILKTGVILLGSYYSFTTIYQLGSVAILIIATFTLGTVALVLWAGVSYRISNSMTGVMSAGMGVCGVSASIAAAPVVQARSTEIAYTIATILVWGMICMLFFPTIGNIMGMNPTQFGAWAGTGILNSAQVIAAADAFDPINQEALKTATAFNITRVLFLPLIVLVLAVWFVQRDQAYDPRNMNMGEILVDRFPIFVLGFVFMFALSSQGVFAPKNHYKGKYFSNRIAASKLLNDKDVNLLQLQLDNRRVILERRRRALQGLIDQRKVISESEEIQLKGLIKRSKITSQAKQTIDKALKAVRHTSNKVKKIKQFIDWLFAFGLVGLGMQITFASIKQAGGTPLFVGSVVGTVKAVGSLFIILYAIDVTVS